MQIRKQKEFQSDKQKALFKTENKTRKKENDRKARSHSFYIGEKKLFCVH